MSLSPVELDYEAIYLACVTYTFALINCVDLSLYYGMSSDPFSGVIYIDESIMEIMMLDDEPWDEFMRSILKRTFRILKKRFLLISLSNQV